ncbi:hypothetical protein D1007_09678 [Hordeum vulgare]|nr:hypothetical protein D1007_09678 [Hordeum vulgare]
MNMNSETIKTTCKDILQESSKNKRHQIKKKYFDTVSSNKVSIKSPVRDLTDDEWQALKEEHKGEELAAIDLFKATYNSKKHGFSELVNIAIAEVKKSTFPRNVGLQSSQNIYSKASVVVAAHLRDLEQKLERSELHAEEMKEELATIKMKTEEAQAACEKEFELLHKKSEENDEKLAHLMALFGAKAG